MSDKDNTMDRRVKRTKTLLETALVELMLEKNGSQISVKELTQRADVNRSTFYLHYLDIYDMMEQIEEEFVSKVEASFHDYFDPLPVSSPLDLFLQICEWLEENKDYYIKLLRGTAAPEILEKLRVRLTEQFLHTLETIFLDQDSLDLRARINFIVSGTIGVLRMWVTEASESALPALAETIEDILTNGLIQDYPKKLLAQYPDYMNRLDDLRKAKKKG